MQKPHLKHLHPPGLRSGTWQTPVLFDSEYTPQQTLKNHHESLFNTVTLCLPQLNWQSLTCVTTNSSDWHLQFSSPPRSLSIIYYTQNENTNKVVQNTTATISKHPTSALSQTSDLLTLPALHKLLTSRKSGNATIRVKRDKESEVAGCVEGCVDIFVLLAQLITSWRVTCRY